MAAAPFLLCGFWRNEKTVVNDLIQHMGFTEEYAKELHAELSNKMHAEVTKKDDGIDCTKGAFGVVADFLQRIEKKKADVEAKFALHDAELQKMGKEMQNLGSYIMNVGTRLQIPQKIRQDCTIMAPKYRKSVTDLLELVVQNVHFALSDEFRRLINQRFGYDHLFCNSGEQPYSE